MEVRGPSGDTFDLTITDYQYPGVQGGGWDGNWLTIDASATVKGRSWRSRDACLTTWEVESLAAWLDAIGEGMQVDPEIAFTEPNLHFELVELGPESVRLRVYFELEARPEWASACGAGANDLWALIERTPEGLHWWADDLRRQLVRFPPR